MDERRSNNDKNWDEIKSFISESRVYRKSDEITQNYQVENIEALKNQVKLQNGRVFNLERWKEEIEIKIKQKKDNNIIFQQRLTVIATVIMAISAIVILFKK